MINKLSMVAAATAFTFVGSLTAALASPGVFLTTDRPDDVVNGVKYQTYPANPYVSCPGYLKVGADEHFLGWDVRHGMQPDLNDWQLNLGLVQRVPSDRPIMPTSLLNVEYVLPSTAVDGDQHSHLWHVFDHNGGSHDVLAELKKASADVWHLSLSGPDSIWRDHYGGPVVDAHNPLILNFDPSGSLMDISGMQGSLNLMMEWHNDPMMGHMSQNVMLDLGPMNMGPGMPGSTRIDGDAFVVAHSYQDGSGPVDIVGSRVDEQGLFYTRYSDGSEEPSYQLAHVRLPVFGGNQWELAKLSDDSVQRLANGMRNLD